MKPEALRDLSDIFIFFKKELWKNIKHQSYEDEQWVWHLLLEQVNQYQHQLLLHRRNLTTLGQKIKRKYCISILSPSASLLIPSWNRTRQARLYNLFPNISLEATDWSEIRYNQSPVWGFGRAFHWSQNHIRNSYWKERTLSKSSPRYKKLLLLSPYLFAISQFIFVEFAYLQLIVI